MAVQSVLRTTGTPGVPQSFSAKADSNQIPAVIYDGATDYMLHTGGPAGASDGTVGTFVWSGTFNSDGSAQTLYDIPGTVPVLLQRQSDNTIDFEVGSAGAVCSASTTAVAASLGFLIVLASFTGTTANLYVIHASGTITGTPSAGSGASADLTANWYLGADGGAADFLDADTAMWWADDSYIDFSDSDNREEFWDTTNDLLRDPGSDGSNPSGAQPLICHVNPAASHDTNRGSGGDADTATSFTDGTSPESFADDYSPSSGIVLEETTGPTHINDQDNSQIITLDYPTTVNADDFLLAHITTDWFDGTGTPTGWTKIETTSNGAYKIESYGRIADGTEDGGTVDFQGAGGGLTQLSGAMTRWSGVDVSGGTVLSCLDATETEDTGTDANPIAPTITTVTNNACVIRLVGSDGNVHSGSGAPATQIYDDSDDVGSGDGTGLAASYAIQATAGASGTASFTLSGSQEWMAQTLALTPA